jgi:hypothetical protein
MKKILLSAILLTGCVALSFAQTEPANPATASEKKYDQFAAVQLNGLIRQVFNFNNSTASTVTNPYLLTYNINSRKTGWGLRLGIGYNYNSSWSNDGVTELSTKINDMQLRLGIEKAFVLTDKWTAGVGLDGLVNINDDNTTSTVRSFDTVITATKSSMTSYGGGVMGWLRYSFTKNISIGTESSFYYTSGNQDNTTDVTRRSGSSGHSITTTETTSKPKISTGTISLPVVFYLAVRF